MERVTFKDKQSPESVNGPVDLMRLLSQIFRHGSPNLSESPDQILINGPIAQVIHNLWDAYSESNAEAASTVLTAFNGDKINSAEIKVGGHGAVQVEKLIPPTSLLRRFHRPRISIHTHIESYPFSLGDLLNILIIKGLYSGLGYFPAMMVINESEIWMAMRSKQTPPMEEGEFWRISNGLDHRVVNGERWQNRDFFEFIKEYSIVLYQGHNRDSRLLVRV